MFPSDHQVSVTRLRVEYAANPIGIDARNPRLSWQLVSSGRGTVQTAYQVRVAEAEAALAVEPIWDTGQVDSDRSVHVDYLGPDLESRRRYFWQVRVWDGSDVASIWSEPAFWEMGLLESSDWLARWIAPEQTDAQADVEPTPMLRRDFELDAGISTARLYVTGLGLYEIEINGETVGDQVFTPGWTAYHSRLQYQTYDIASKLRPGKNAIGAWLGDGWYRGFLSWDGSRNLYGDRLALLAQIEIHFDNGIRLVLSSDQTWKSSTGPIVGSDIYMGERYDARLEHADWSMPDFDDTTWSDAEPIEHATDILVAASGPAIRRIEELRPVAISMAPSGNPVVDMGQNFVGRIRIKASGPAGTAITLHHAEVLNPDGSLYRQNLRGARQEVTYIMKGHGEEVYEPRFTFQGFRYVEVDGYPGELAADDILGIVIHSDMETTGIFETSNPLINQLQRNIVWGQKGNFLDIPTDCPQRDERLGWTGDAQVFARTAAFNMQVAPFFTKWLADLEADQKPNGSVPWVVPDVLADGIKASHGATGWGDAAVIIPWTLYQVYGDTKILREQYDSMRRWVDFMRGRAGDDLVWTGDQHFGDWLAFSPTDPGYPGATTSKDLIATAYFAHSTDLLSRIAGILNELDDEKEYRYVFEATRAAFQTEFITATGRLVSETQTAYAIALAFNLVPPSDRDRAVERLVSNIRSFGHLTTGFLGAPLLTHVLSENGQLDVAYDLLTRTEYPSWLYPVTMGATTIWERWDSLKPDGSFQDPQMNSFNHYAYGAVGDWMYRVIAGIGLDPDEPGYKHILIRPRPGGGLTHAKGALATMYGEVRSEWALNDGAFRLIVAVPANTRATIYIPAGSSKFVSEGGRRLESVDGIRIAGENDGVVEVGVGSGLYDFFVSA